MSPMNPRIFALFGGLALLIIGVLSLVPQLVGPMTDLPRLAVETSYGNFLGLFPMNIFNKVAAIVLGAAGVWAAQAKGRSLPMSIHYSRAMFALAGILAVLGLFPATNTLFGYWPLFGNNVWSSALFSVLGAFFGFALTAKVPADRTGSHLPRESLAR